MSLPITVMVAVSRGKQLDAIAALRAILGYDNISQAEAYKAVQEESARQIALNIGYVK